MDKVIMPDIITPVFEEMIVENPEILRMIVGYQPGEEVIMGQDCTLECSGNPTNVKLLFCNVTIGLDGSVDECDKDHSLKEAEEQFSNYHIKINDRDCCKKDCQWDEPPVDLNELRLEVAVLEMKVNTLENILRLIPRLPSTRKVVARCKIEANEAIERLAALKSKLEYKVWVMQSGK